MARKILLLTLATTLLAAGAAFGAGALKGKTYKGSAGATGVSGVGRRKPFYGSTAIKLKVSGNGKTVTVSFPSTYVIQYCRTTEKLFSQQTKPARISSSGSFEATIAERFFKSPGEAQYHQIVKGRFSGSTVKGTIHTVVGATPPCSGITSFSAKS